MKLPVQQLMIFLSAAIVAIAFFGGTPIRSYPKQEVDLNYWITYWDIKSGADEYRQIQEKARSISYFAAYFDKNNQLFIPAEVASAKAAAQKGHDTYLTIVNDKTRDGESFSEKDIPLLKEILDDNVSLNQNVREIIKLAQQGSYDGIEIDYEQIAKVPSLQQSYLHFIDVLYRHADAQGLKVRIVLEPSVDFTAGFPTGPQYVVMLYNLYGTHSGPGPKADERFILSMLKKMDALPANRAVAFSCGGCMWTDGHNGTFIDESQAASLAAAHSIKPTRDIVSKALYFKYEEAGKTRTVWYADADTLNHWIDIAAAHGISNVSIWRLGHNMDIKKIGT